MNLKHKFLSRFIITLLIVSLMVGSVAFADTLPYVTYNYDYWEDYVMTPAAYVPHSTISGQSLGLDGELGSIYDIYVDPDSKRIFLCDNTNNQIVVVNGYDFSLVTVIKEFYNTETGNTDTFNNPQGVYLSPKNELYVCDTDNGRFVKFKTLENGEYEFISHFDGSMIISDILADDYTFKPVKICVDSADRIYIINLNEFQGILQLEQNGVFNGYFGTITVSISLWQKFWKTISTKAQRAKSTMFIPTEYTGIDIDDNGFLFASYIDNNGQQAVMRINSKGGDVIRKGANQNVGGDIAGTQYSMNIYCGTSRIKDVVYCGSGMYSLLDTLRGRIFTYDREGNLLYIYGGQGSQDGTFQSASSIETLDNYRLVCDVKRNAVNVFSPTEYGTLINEAVACRYDGDESLAVDKWNQVLRLNENFEQAYIGIGKAYLNDGHYKKAMDYLELGMSKSYYSIAYKRYRNNVLKQNFNVIFGVVLVAIVGFIGFKIYKKRKNKSEY